MKNLRKSRSRKLEETVIAEKIRNSLGDQTATDVIAADTEALLKTEARMGRIDEDDINRGHGHPENIEVRRVDTDHDHRESDGAKNQDTARDHLEESGPEHQNQKRQGRSHIDPIATGKRSTQYFEHQRNM